MDKAMIPNSPGIPEILIVWEKYFKKCRCRNILEIGQHRSFCLL